MKYTIEGFSQKYAMTLKKTIERNGKQVEIKVDCTDLIILRWLVDFFPSTKKMDIDGVQYAWITHNKLCEELPIVDISKRAFSERLQKLVEFDILEYKLLKENGTFSLYRFGKNYKNLISSKEQGCASESGRDVVQTTPPYVVQTTTKDTSINNTSINKENYIKESCEIRNGNQVTTSFVVNNENLVHAQSVEIGTETPTSTNTNMFVVNNEQNEPQQKVIVEELHSDYNDVINFFNKTYSIYPRKECKIQAKTTYTHKVYSNDAELNKLIATRIYKCLQRQIVAWENENNGSGRDKQYVPLFSSWLNSNFEDIPKKDRGKKQ